MDQKWIHILMILVCCQKMTSGAVNVKIQQEGHQAEIKCKPPSPGTMIVWFRLLDTSNMEFIGSFAISGMKKSVGVHAGFTYSKMEHNILTLTSFNRSRDSGAYSCASLKSNDLVFGEVTRLVGVQIETQAPPIAITKPKPTQASAPCVCKEPVRDSRLSCSLIILAPLAGSCGLLLLLLIIISVYCNQIRTRRCPHHYKRKPRAMAPGKQVMANRNI